MDYGKTMTYSVLIGR